MKDKSLNIRLGAVTVVSHVVKFLSYVLKLVSNKKPELRKSQNKTFQEAFKKFDTSTSGQVKTKLSINLNFNLKLNLNLKFGSGEDEAVG